MSQAGNQVSGERKFLGGVDVTDRIRDFWASQPNANRPPEYRTEPVPPSIDSEMWDAFSARMRASAVRTLVLSRKNRVRLLIAKPWRLDVIWEGLSREIDGLPDDRKLIAVAETLLERTNLPTANVGFGGESPRITAQALMLYGRAVRRFRARQAMKVAA